MPPIRCAPVTEHMPYHSKPLCKKMACASGVWCTNNMHPLSWGAPTEKIQDFCILKKLSLSHYSRPHLSGQVTYIPLPSTMVIIPKSGLYFSEGYIGKDPRI